VPRVQKKIQAEVPHWISGVSLLGLALAQALQSAPIPLLGRYHDDFGIASIVFGVVAAFNWRTLLLVEDDAPASTPGSEPPPPPPPATAA
jgi:hypothetical protein